MIKRAMDLSLYVPASRGKPPPLSPTRSHHQANQISGSDLLDVPHGEAEVKGYSGISSSGGKCDPACGRPCCVTENPNGRFSGSGGSSCRATVFADGQQVGSEHWIEWRTRKAVTLKRVALCAAHDAIGLRHSLGGFKLYVKEQAKWSKITEHNPALMYGVSGESKPCFPLPAKPYTPGSVLAACISLEPTAGQDLRAVFAEAASSLETFSGPRVLRPDG